MTHAPLNRMARLALVTLAAGAVLAACGSNSSTSKTSSNAAGGSGARRTALAACLRKHGVTVPATAGGIPYGGPPSGGAPSGAPAGGGPGAPSAKFQAAFKACGASAPSRGGGGFARPAVTKYVTCVRQHGYALPKPNFSGQGSVFPASVQSNAKFQSANRACQSLLRPSGSPGAPPGA